MIYGVVFFVTGGIARSSKIIQGKGKPLYHLYCDVNITSQYFGDVQKKKFLLYFVVHILN